MDATKIDLKINSKIATIEIYKEDDVTRVIRLDYNVEGYDTILKLLSDYKLEVSKDGQVFTIEPIKKIAP